jgi:hypothetical protein
LVRVNGIEMLAGSVPHAPLLRMLALPDSVAASHE